MVGRYTDIFPYILHLALVHPILSCARLPSRLFGLDTVHVCESPIKVDNVGVFNLQTPINDTLHNRRKHTSPSSLSTSYFRGE